MRGISQGCEKMGPYAGTHAHKIAVASSRLAEFSSPTDETRWRISAIAPHLRQTMLRMLTWLSSGWVESIISSHNACNANTRTRCKSLQRLYLCNVLYHVKDCTYQPPRRKTPIMPIFLEVFIWRFLIICTGRARIRTSNITFDISKPKSRLLGRQVAAPGVVSSSKFHAAETGVHWKIKRNTATIAHSTQIVPKA